MAVPEQPARPVPGALALRQEALREHVRVLNSANFAGRATGTQGLARAANYVAARMAEYRLQPAVDDDFRLVYRTPLNYPTSALMSTIGPDSLLLIPGVDFLPDGRSDSGRVGINRLLLAPRSGNMEIGDSTAVLMPASEATDAHLVRLQRAGAAAVLTVGRLEPVPRANPLAGLVVVQVAPAALAALLDVPEAVVASVLERREDTVVLPQPLVIRVATDRLRMGGALNVIGYVAGKHPVLSREALLVCAELDAVGDFAGVRTLDFRNFGRGAAALLELARHYGYVSRRWNVPDRSIIFALWSGSRLNHGGLRAYLAHPTWSLAKTHAVVYIGVAPGESTEVSRVIEEAGLVLRTVPLPGQPLHTRPTVLQPAVAQPRTRAGTASDRDEIDLEAVFARAVDDARALTQEAHDIILRETTAAAPAPSYSDSLSVPAMVED